MPAASLFGRIVPEKLAYTVPEACAVTGIGRTSLYEDIRAGRLTARKRGTSTLILMADLVAYLDNLPIAKASVKRD
jgi:excisionase family DNA binding protein